MSGTGSKPLGFTCRTLHLPEQHASTALAVLLTQISHSHNALLQTLAEGHVHHASPIPALLPASPSSHMPSKSTHQEHMSTAGKQSDLTSDFVSSQHVNSDDQGYPSLSRSADMSAAVKLCPFQEELAERVLKADNAVIFLPAGMLYEGSCTCPWVCNTLVTLTLIQL